MLAAIDLVIILIYFVFICAGSYYFPARRIKNLSSFGNWENVIFSVDLPLVLTALVWSYGIAGGWLWWGFGFSGLIALCFFSRLWKKSGVNSELQLINLRYSGRAKTVLWGIESFFTGGIFTCVVLGWLILAIVKVFSFGLPFFPKWLIIIIVVVLIDFYSVLAKYLRKEVINFIQFGIITVGSIILVGMVINRIGSMGELQFRLGSPTGDFSLHTLFPGAGSSRISALTLFVYVGLLWWAVPESIASFRLYPSRESIRQGGQVGSSPEDGKKYFLISFGQLLFRYIFSPWLWILAGLAGMIAVSPHDPEMGFLQAIFFYLPSGITGLLLGGFLFASLTIINRYLDLSVPSLVKDFYKKFLKPKASPYHYLVVSKFTTLFLIIIAGIIAYWLKSVREGWEFLLTLTAGIGVVRILRWYWWRVNAAGEIAGMVTPFILCLGLKFGTTLDWSQQMLMIIGITTLVWLGVTLFTEPTSLSKLVEFYKKVEPPGRWAPVSRLLPEITTSSRIGPNFCNLLLGSLVAGALLFGIGKFVFGQWLFAGGCFLISGIGMFLFWRNMKKEV